MELNSIIERFDAIIEYPKIKIMKDGVNMELRNPDFAVFILTFGRCDSLKTAHILLKESCSFDQDYYFICSTDDPSLQAYKNKFGKRVIVFDKKIMAKYCDFGDNIESKNIVLYARNVCFSIANIMKYKRFVVLDDDYYEFSNRFLKHKEKCTNSKITYDYNLMFNSHIKLLECNSITTITMSQMGDYIGGYNNPTVQRGFQRKVMNSFFCKLESPFDFIGSINEDVNYYVTSGRKGVLNFNMYGWALNQFQTQKNIGGLTDYYLKSGTYLKSFYSVIFCPSSVKVGYIGNGKSKRFHHSVKGATTYVQIIDEKWKTETPKNGIELDQW